MAKLGFGFHGGTNAPAGTSFDYSKKFTGVNLVNGDNALTHNLGALYEIVSIDVQLSTGETWQSDKFVETSVNIVTFDNAGAYNNVTVKVNFRNVI